MRQSWSTAAFEDCIEPVQYTRKVQRTEFLADGRFPVISQESAFINGYWDEEADVFAVGTPVVLFGDHTKSLKYVDFDFVLGADGVKVLQPRPFLLPKFFYYALQSIDLRSLGYARHYRLLKEQEISWPDLGEQRRIVAVLDEAFAGIAAARVNAERNLRNARALFESYASATFATRGDGWHTATVDQLATNLDGKRIPITKNKRQPGDVPYYGASGIVDYVAEHIFEGDALLVSEDGANLLARSTPIAFSVTGRYWVNNHAHVLLFPDMPTQKYVEHYLESIAIDEFVTGAAQPKLTQGALNSIPIPIPADGAERASIVERLECLSEHRDGLISIYERKLAALDELKQSLLHHAFTGQLTASRPKPVAPARPARVVSPIERHAGVLAIAHRRHVRHGRARTFGRVKSEKLAHLVESHLGIDLGRSPVKAAAGPNDFPQLLRMEAHARRAGWFDVVGSRDTGYEFHELAGFDAFVARAETDLGDRRGEVEHLIELLLPLKSDQAELVTTVYAAWNNRLLDGLDASDENIVREAREHWHKDKLDFPRDRFFEALAWLREHGVTPSGTGRRVADAPRPDSAS